MCDDLGVTDEIKAFVLDILSKNSFGSTTCEVQYFAGSALGDGYGSKTIGVDITEDGRTLHLFLKCALPGVTVENFNDIYKTEILLYKTIYPAYRKFLTDKGVENGFRNVPECYGVFEETGSEIVALENLRKRNYVMYERSKCMNDAHMKLILETFAKFHAISFAFKDQQKELHEDFLGNRINIFINLKHIGLNEVISNMVKDFLSKLDPVEDKDILDRSENLASGVYDHFTKLECHLSDYSILTKGDCWVNNMMFLYENGDTQTPLDVMLVDWQGVARASPLHDIGGLFLQVSSKETLDNFNHYLRFYHDELSKRIKELGSNPEVLYPYEALEKEWVKYGLYFFGIAIMSVNVMLCDKENVPVLKDEDIVESTSSAAHLFGNINSNEELVLERLRYIVRHLIRIGTL